MLTFHLKLKKEEEREQRRQNWRIGKKTRANERKWGKSEVN